MIAMTILKDWQKLIYQVSTLLLSTLIFCLIELMKLLSQILSYLIREQVLMIFLEPLLYIFLQVL